MAKERADHYHSNKLFAECVNWGFESDPALEQHAAADTVAPEDRETMSAALMLLASLSTEAVKERCHRLMPAFWAWPCHLVLSLLRATPQLSLLRYPVPELPAQDLRSRNPREIRF